VLCRHLTEHGGAGKNTSLSSIEDVVLISAIIAVFESD
jgi:hypothetical protein